MHFNSLMFYDKLSHLFMMKKGYAKMKMVEIIKGKYCGKGHDGEKAFASNRAEFCARCHKKM
jgi:c(7)-type cytochrome triheme protein